MRILIRKAKIVYPNSTLNGTVIDILVEQGVIAKIQDEINPESEVDFVIEEEDLHVSIGLCDIGATFGEPGLETKEDINSGVNAAIKGGYSCVAITPNTNPTISNRSYVEYVLNKAKDKAVKVYPLGSVSQDTKGEELAEMYDMKQAGAVAFTDGKKAIQNAHLLSRALLYTKSFEGVVMTFANDKQINHKGVVNEGEMSTHLGLEGIPHLAEELQVARDIYLAEYNNSPIHIRTLSSKKSVDLIREAQKKGIRVTADVAAHQLVFTDESLSDFDSLYKVLPPYRTLQDIEALKQGIKEGVISSIVSDHTPVEVEDKEKEFDLASFGIINLQTAFPLMLTHLSSEFSLEELIDKMAIQPRKILKIAVPEIKEGVEADLLLFSPTKKWRFKEKDIVSKSKNTPFVNTEFVGGVYGVLSNRKFTKSVLL